jgi:hypothetical protein
LPVSNVALSIQFFHDSFLQTLPVDPNDIP